MDNIQSQFVKNIIGEAFAEGGIDAAESFAPSNIALCKYWGKRDPVLNLPINSSLSISLGELGTRTRLQRSDLDMDQIFLNGDLQDPSTSFAKRLSAFLDLFRPYLVGSYFRVDTTNTVPTAAGLASSASGFAALVLALNELGGWGLDKKSCSMLARLGSGSASRSVYEGFVQWHAGERSDGMDSFASPLDKAWPDFKIGILELCSAPKSVGSREGMNRTVETAALYKSWPQQAEADLLTIKTAIEEGDFSALGATAEQNALSMHATMMAAWPPLIYLQPESIELIHKVHQVRAEGLDVYLTMDAGPNVKLLFLEESRADVQSVFPSLQII